MNLLITGALGHIGSYYLTHVHKIKNINKIYVIDKINEKILNLINLKIRKKIHFFNQDLSKEKINLRKRSKNCKKNLLVMQRNKKQCKKILARNKLS